MIIHKCDRDPVLMFILLLQNKAGKKNVKFLVSVITAVCCFVAFKIQEKTKRPHFIEGHLTPVLRRKKGAEKSEGASDVLASKENLGKGIESIVWFLKPRKKAQKRNQSPRMIPEPNKKATLLNQQHLASPHSLIHNKIRGI